MKCNTHEINVCCKSLSLGSFVTAAKLTDTHKIMLFKKQIMIWMLGGQNEWVLTLEVLIEKVTIKLRYKPWKIISHARNQVKRIAAQGTTCSKISTRKAFGIFKKLQEYQHGWTRVLTSYSIPILSVPSLLARTHVFSATVISLDLMIQLITVPVHPSL